MPFHAIRIIDPEEWLLNSMSFRRRREVLHVKRGVVPYVSTTHGTAIYADQLTPN